MAYTKAAVISMVFLGVSALGFFMALQAGSDGAEGVYLGAMFTFVAAIAVVAGLGWHDEPED